jgi:hypothetical protein
VPYFALHHARRVGSDAVHAAPPIPLSAARVAIVALTGAQRDELAKDIW